MVTKDSRAVDDLMERVGRAVRAAESESPLSRGCWEELAADRLDPEDLSRLGAGDLDDDAVGWARAACRPISAAGRAELLRRALGEVGRRDRTSGGRGRRTGEGSAPRLARIALRVGAIAAGLIGLVVIWALRTAGPELPSYGMEFSGGDVNERSAQGSPCAAPTPLGFASVVEIVLRPETPPAAPVDLRVLAIGARSVIRLPARIERSAAGAFHIYGEVESALGLPEGRWTLVFCIGPPARLAELWSDSLAPEGALQAASDRGLQVFTRSVVVSRSR